MHRTGRTPLSLAVRTTARHVRNTAGKRVPNCRLLHPSNPPPHSAPKLELAPCGKETAIQVFFWASTPQVANRDNWPPVPNFAGNQGVFHLAKSFWPPVVSH